MRRRADLEYLLQQCTCVADVTDCPIHVGEVLVVPELTDGDRAWIAREWRAATLTEPQEDR